jgi:hypothetical protein
VNAQERLTAHEAGALQRVLRQLHGAMTADARRVLLFGSVTAAGDLAPQQGVAAANAGLAMHCDLFIAHYHDMPERCADDVAAAVPEVAGCVDVFGRGNRVLGQDQTAASVATMLRRRFSVALFAPGWTAESDPCEGDVGRFVAAELALWQAVAAAVRLVGGVAARPANLAVGDTAAVPFNTFFNLGCGSQYAHGGVAQTARPAVHVDDQDFTALQLPVGDEASAPHCVAAAAGFLGFSGMTLKAPATAPYSACTRIASVAASGATLLEVAFLASAQATAVLRWRGAWLQLQGVAAAGSSDVSIAPVHASVDAASGWATRRFVVPASSSEDCVSLLVDAGNAPTDGTAFVTLGRLSLSSSASVVNGGALGAEFPTRRDPTSLVRFGVSVASGSGSRACTVRVTPVAATGGFRADRCVVFVDGGVAAVSRQPAIPIDLPEGGAVSVQVVDAFGTMGTAVPLQLPC